MFISNTLTSICQWLSIAVITPIMLAIAADLTIYSYRNVVKVASICRK